MKEGFKNKLAPFPVPEKFLVLEESENKDEPFLNEGRVSKISDEGFILGGVTVIKGLF